jgi:hypothetical protein
VGGGGIAAILIGQLAWIAERWSGGGRTELCAPRCERFSSFA